MNAMPTVNQITGRTVLAICAGFFGVMFAVNAVFVFFAISTFNGGEGGKAYQRGLDYNSTIAAERAQDMLGWSHRIEAAPGGTVTVSLADNNAAPVAGLAVSGEIARPAADKFTRSLAFREIEPGTYIAEAGALNAGNWVVSLAAARLSAKSEDILYRAKARLWLKP